MSAAFMFDSVRADLWTAQIAVGTDTFYMLLVTADPLRSNAKRSDIANEVPNGSGYVTGGIACTLSLSLDAGLHVESINATSTSFTSVVLSGVVGAVVYKHRGGAASADNLLGYILFSAPVTITPAGTLTVPACAFTETNT